jgi:hypothetical protein
MKPPVPEEPPIDELLKRKLLDELGANEETSFKDLKLQFGAKKIDRLLRLLVAENKVECVDREGEPKEDAKWLRTGLLMLRPKWYGWGLYVTSGIAEVLGVATVLGVAVFLIHCVETATDELVTGKGLTNPFDWSKAISRWPLVAVVAGLLAILYLGVLQNVSLRTQGYERRVSFVRLVMHTLGLLPRALWAVLVAVFYGLRG